MLWFKKKKAAIKETKALQAKVLKEVARHEQIREETIKESTEVAIKFKDTVIRNGFTLVIHVAAGGKR